MKAVSFKIPKTERESFRVQIDQLPYFYDRLHNHPELQIMYIVDGHGSCFIGDKVAPFQASDLFVIGSNIPHVFQSDAQYKEMDSTLQSESLSIFFKQEAFGNDFFDLPELARIKDFIRKTSRGFRVFGATKSIVVKKLLRLKTVVGFDRILLLLETLKTLSLSNELEVISNTSFEKRENEQEENRLNSVFQYVMDNYSQAIKLATIAKVANMSEAAFCRYFKTRTQKTFIQFVNEIRVGAACKQLLHREKTIAQICYEVGFNNLSNFNRQFKNIMGVTPSDYVKEIRF